MTWNVLKSQSKTSQVRKQLELVVFGAPASATDIEDLTDAQGALKPLPATYFPFGLITRDGVTSSVDTETDETQAHGYAQNVREDIIGATQTLSVTVYEVYRKRVLEAAYGIDLTTVKKAASGEIKFDRPPLPVSADWKLLVVGRDVKGGLDVYRAKFHPKARLGQLPEEAWGTEALRFELQFTIAADDKGIATREFIAGPGMKADTDAGFTAT